MSFPERRQEGDHLREGHPGKLTGCSRGIYGLSSWRCLCKEMGQAYISSAIDASLAESGTSGSGKMHETGKGDMSENMKNGSEKSNYRYEREKSHNRIGEDRKENRNAEMNYVNGNAGEKNDNRNIDSKSDSSNGDSKTDNRSGAELLTKYSYTANPNSPIGIELSIKQQEKLIYLKSYDDHWWLVRNEGGATGYVPASYVMFLEKKCKQLPWLQSKPIEAEVVKIPQEAPVKGPVKYRSAYEHDGLPTKPDDKPYYCKICDRNLNGPKPYQSHINSKAHKEEVELANIYQHDSQGFSQNS